MDLTEEKVSFDQMPTVVSELKDEIRGLKVLIGNLIDRAFSPESASEIGMLTIKTANQTIEDAARRPDPDQLYKELWYEGEVYCLFAVQMADDIARTRSTSPLRSRSAPSRKNSSPAPSNHPMTAT